MTVGPRWTLSIAVTLAAGTLGVAAPLGQTAQKPPAAPEFTDLESFYKSLPAATVRPIDPASALLFTTVPLACLDELQPKPSTRPYFWEVTYKTVDNYDRTRAFYGCNDWHTAVNATWTVVTMLKRYPDLPVGGLIREKLTDHLGRPNLEGELAFFRDAGAFERPYGYAWLLKLQAELGSWKDTEASRWADNVAPLGKYFADAIIAYLIDLDRANKAASQANTAFSLGLLLDYADLTHDTTVARATADTARRLFQTDVNCGTDSEAASPELVSPCLAEAALMSRVLDRTAFVPWLDAFLPPVYSAKFKPLTTLSLDATGTGRRGSGGRGARAAGAAPPSTPPPQPERPPTTGERGAGAADPPKTIEAQAAAAPGGAGRGSQPANPRATWTGLGFTRAEAFSRLAAALPESDPRVRVFRRLADIHAEKGHEGLGDATAFDAPWLGAYSIGYLQTLGSSR